MIEMMIFNNTAILEINNTIASGENLKSRNYDTDIAIYWHCNLLELRLNVKNQIKTKKRGKIKKLYKLLILIGKISIQY